jgi:hypothetical protein
VRLPSIPPLRRFALSPLTAVGMGCLAGLNLLGMYWLASTMDPTLSPSMETASGTAHTALRKDKSAPGTKPLSAYQTTLNRPLFFKARKPYTPPPSPSPPPPPVTVAAPAPPPAPPSPIPDPELTLAGVTITAGVRKAYLAQRGNATEGSWVAEGETVLGWQVSAIHEQSIALRHGSRTVELSLYKE